MKYLLTLTLNLGWAIKYPVRHVAEHDWLLLYLGRSLCSLRNTWTSSCIVYVVLTPVVYTCLTSLEENKHRSGGKTSHWRRSRPSLRFIISRIRDHVDTQFTSMIISRSVCVCVCAGLDVWWSDGGHSLLQGGTHLQEVRPLQGSWWGQSGQGESVLSSMFVCKHLLDCLSIMMLFWLVTWSKWIINN